PISWTYRRRILSRTMTCLQVNPGWRYFWLVCTAGCLLKTSNIWLRGVCDTTPGWVLLELKVPERRLTATISPAPLPARKLPIGGMHLYCFATLTNLLLHFPNTGMHSLK